MAKNTPSKQPTAVVPDDNAPIDVNEVLESLTPAQRKVILSTMIAMEQRSYSGPLPAPEDFEAYEKVLPGATDRIMSMAEKSLDSRVNNEKAIIDARIKQGVRGQIYGFILALVFIGVATFLALQGHDVLAGIIAGGDIVSLAVIFVLNREPRKKNEEEHNLEAPVE